MNTDPSTKGEIPLGSGSVSGSGLRSVGSSSRGVHIVDISTGSVKPYCTSGLGLDTNTSSEFTSDLHQIWNIYSAIRQYD